MNYGSDSGTNVLARDKAQYYEIGGGWSNQTFGFFGATRKIGRVLRPHRRIYLASRYRRLRALRRQDLRFQPGRQTRLDGRCRISRPLSRPALWPGAERQSAHLDILTKKALDLQFFSGSNYWRFGDILTPITQNGGFQFTYDSGLQTNNPGNFPYHGPVGLSDDRSPTIPGATERGISTRGFARRRFAWAIKAR